MKLNYSYAYDSNNFLHSLTDHIADQVTVYTYDTYGNLDRTYTYDSETYKNLYEVNVAVSPTENRMEFVLERLDYTHTAGFGTAETTFDFFFYEKNLQGDIIGIFNTNGRRVGWYIYDAWGACTATVASGVTSLERSIVTSYNPFRYRGYYYDVESSLYYLQSRYYNPQWGRFLNADGYINANGDILGYNMFAYCGNNPVMGYDPTGEWNWSKFFSGANLLAVGAMAVATAATVLTCGAASPLMVGVAAVTATAGLATAVNGVAEVVEAGTDYNIVRDGLMGGDAEAYETYKNVTQTVAEVGTMITGAYIAANGGSVCFIAGTLIATENGLVPIEDIRPGDLVWATDEKTGETALKEVVQLFRNETEEWVHISVNGEELICTPEHPFYSPVKGWTSAIDLRAGDILVMLNGEYVVIEQVQHELLETPEETYNFEVADFHTYHVGEQSLLVHNKCDLIDAPKTTHGKIRIGERGLTQREYDLLKSSTNIKHQADGATVYIRQITSNNHRVLVENTGGQIITYIKNVTKHGLKNLARNYGWY